MPGHRMRRAAAGGVATTFEGGNQTIADLYALVQSMNDNTSDMATPSAGGTLTVNSESLGSYDYVIKDGSQTISSFSNSDWFTTTEDSRSAFAVVKGDLTLNAGQTFRPSHRKLFTVVYVTGDLEVNGDVSMTARGANHTADDGNVSAAAIRIATGTFSTVSNPEVPAAGANGGGPAQPVANGGHTPPDGTDGQTGGGGSGGSTSSGTSGAGSAGTSFSGGTGGGSVRTGGPAEDGEANGGKGGDAASDGTNAKGGGAGNPGGVGYDGGDSGADGTGGVLIIFVGGEYSGSGSVVAGGSNGGDGNRQGGGGSGGGSITIICGSNNSGPTPSAPGGSGGAGSEAPGGDGSAGTARVLLF